MTDKKELLKALVCRANDPIVDCTKCPYYEDSFAGSCDYQRICRDALSMLRDQDERIKRLIEDAKILGDALDEKEDGDD